MSRKRNGNWFYIVVKHLQGEKIGVHTINPGVLTFQFYDKIDGFSW